MSFGKGLISGSNKVLHLGAKCSTVESLIEDRKAKSKKGHKSEEKKNAF